MLERPKRVGDCRQVIDQGHGTAVLGQVNRSQIKLARVTRIDPHVRGIFRDVHWQFVFRFFATRGAQDAPELPFLRAERAEQKSVFRHRAFGNICAQQGKGSPTGLPRQQIIGKRTPTG